MIDALIHGRIVHSRLEGPYLVGRIVIQGDIPVQFTARRGAVKKQLEHLPVGSPLSVAGELSTSVQNDKHGQPNVRYEVAVSAVLTAAQPKGLLGSIL